jgi:glycosyltransferase involved in cell wall biosynthesis
VRLAIVTETRARVGGAETYLERVIPGLAARHAVAFWSASEGSGDRGAIALPAGVEVLGAGATMEDAVGRLRAFDPDLVFAHGLGDADLEARLLAVAPAVAVEHNYHGTCISGSKTMTFPQVRACGRRFGPACLALYFPRRCGGLSPTTMVRMYRRQSTRLATLGRCAAVVTLSRHMRDELVRNGVAAARVHVVPPFVAPWTAPPDEPGPAGSPVRLLFIGRLEPLKGLPRLLDALPLVARRLGRPVMLTVAGDGADRAALENQARGIEAGDARVRVVFAGWQSAEGRDRLLASTDAIVVPSLWPEPFGLVGIEAAIAGVPGVAFATGGIVDWLKDGETGCLAPAAGARHEALADAIVRCVGVEEVRTRLGRGARAQAAGLTLDRHLSALDAVLSHAARAAGTGAHA